jgi:hypothetical protein
MVKFLVGLSYDGDFIRVFESDDKIQAIEIAKNRNADLSNSVKFISLVKDLNKLNGWVVMEEVTTLLPVAIN